MQKKRNWNFFSDPKGEETPSVSPDRMKAEELAFMHILLSFSGELQADAF